MRPQHACARILPRRYWAVLLASVTVAAIGGPVIMLSLIPALDSADGDEQSGESGSFPWSRAQRPVALGPGGLPLGALRSLPPGIGFFKRRDVCTALATRVGSETRVEDKLSKAESGIWQAYRCERNGFPDSCTWLTMRLAAPADADGVARVYLASYPGSGNTYVRLVLEKTTGYATGSVYGDMSLVTIGFAGEIVSAHTLANLLLTIKTHRYPHEESADLIRAENASLVPEYGLAVVDRMRQRVEAWQLDAEKTLQQVDERLGEALLDANNPSLTHDGQQTIELLNSQRRHALSTIDALKVILMRASNASSQAQQVLVRLWEIRRVCLEQHSIHSYFSLPREAIAFDGLDASLAGRLARNAELLGRLQGEVEAQFVALRALTWLAHGVSLAQLNTSCEAVDVFGHLLKSTDAETGVKNKQQAAIVLVRSPLKAVFSSFEYLVGGHRGGGSREAWLDYVQLWLPQQLVYWRRLLRDWRTVPGVVLGQFELLSGGGSTALGEWDKLLRYLQKAYQLPAEAFARTRLLCALAASEESRRQHVFKPSSADLFLAHQVPLLHGLVGQVVEEFGYVLPSLGPGRTPPVQLQLDRSHADWARWPVDLLCCGKRCSHVMASAGQRSAARCDEALLESLIDRLLAGRDVLVVNGDDASGAELLANGRRLEQVQLALQAAVPHVLGGLSVAHVGPVPSDASAAGVASMLYVPCVASPAAMLGGVLGLLLNRSNTEMDLFQAAGLYWRAMTSSFGTFTHVDDVVTSAMLCTRLAWMCRSVTTLQSSMTPMHMVVMHA